MKKLLALVLALVMTMSLVTISNAAFSDAADIDYKEAVDVLAAVGVLEGSDGKFDPKAELTREQAAKIIAYLDLGKSTAESLPAVKVFNDVEASRWSAKFVAYCADAGYINGVGNGNFDPTGKLTGYAFGKLLLCALGYDATLEEMTGASWTIKVAKLMESNDLTKGTSKLGSAVLTREEAAQYALNALKATTVDYDEKGSTITAGDVTIVTGAKKATAVKTTKDTGAIADEKDKEGTLQLGEKLYDSDLKKTSATDDFGRKASQWKYKTEEIGKYADKADATYTGKVTKATLYTLIGKDAVKDLTAGTATLTVTVDGKPLSSPAVADYIVDKNTAAAAGTGKGTSTEVYINDNNNNVDIIIINTYLIKATDDYNSKKETVKTETITGAAAAPVAASELTISSDDFAVENVKEDDYLLITCAGTAATNKAIKSVEPATVVTGNVDSYSNSSVTIAGTKYEYAVKADTSTTHGTGVTYEIGEAAKVVTDGKYIYYVDEATVAADKYVYITEIAREGNFSTSGDFQAKAYFLDGTQKTITLKDKYSDNTAVSAVPVNTWFAYSVNSSNKYTLTKLTAKTDGNTAAENYTNSTATAATEGAVLTENGKVNVNGGAIGAIKANAATVFVVVDKDDNVNVYTGVANVPTIKSKGAAVTAYYTYAKNTSYAKYVFIDADGASLSDASSSSSDFIYLLKYDNTNKDAGKNTYYTYKAIVNGEEKKINLSDNFTDSETVYALYTDVKYNDKTGYVDTMNPVDTNDDYTTSNLTGTVAYEDGVLTIGGQDYVVGKDAKIYLIAADSNVKEDDGSTYEVSAEISANALYSTLKGYTIGAKTVGSVTTNSNYNVQVKDDVMTALYVFVANTTAA